MSNSAVEISRLPLSQVAGAYKKFCRRPAAGITKQEATKWLAERVDEGGITLAEIQSAPRDTFAAAIPAASVAYDEMRIATVQASVSGLTDSVTSIRAALRDTETNLRESLTNDLDFLRTKQNADAAAVTRKLDKLADQVKNFKVDDDTVAAQVSQLVADAFAPFKQAVQDAKLEQVIGDMAAVRVIGAPSAKDVFGLDVLDMTGKQVLVNIWNHPAAPDIDPDFIWTEPILRHLLLSQETGENIWFGGEKGTGKSETARQFAAKTGRAFTRINFHKHTSAEEYIGAVGLKDGATVFEPKDFLLAYTQPSTVILLDEVTNADAGELAPLNGYLEPKAAVSFGGQVHRRAAGVLVFAADNTFGNGDETGRHAGTRVQNSALIDRFARVVQFQFLPKASEVDAISRHTGCTTDLANHVVTAIHACRAKVEEGEIVDAPSIRSAMAFIRALRLLPVADAWHSAVVCRQPSESAAVLDAIRHTYIDTDFIANNI